LKWKSGVKPPQKYKVVFGQVLCTCPEITWYFCHLFTSDLPIAMQSYYWTSTLHLSRNNLVLLPSVYI
jgi:hypothetical protein